MSIPRLSSEGQELEDVSASQPLGTATLTPRAKQQPLREKMVCEEAVRAEYTVQSPGQVQEAPGLGIRTCCRACRDLRPQVSLGQPESRTDF